MEKLNVFQPHNVCTLLKMCTITRWRLLAYAINFILIQIYNEKTLK